MPSTDILRKKSTILLFAYSPTGLGHLRVTDALYEGLPENVAPLLLISQGKTVTFLHRITSVHPIFRAIFEWTQRGWAEDIFAHFYRTSMEKNTKLLYEQLITIIDQRIESPELIIIVSTHFGLNHQLSSIKSKIEDEKHARVVLVAQVTDDSPQHIWYAQNADLIMVPSHTTKEKLEEYAEKAKLKKTNIEVLPYPISPFLTKVLTKKEYQNRLDQLTFNSQEPINFCVPISGAAVGMDYFTKLIDRLRLSSQRFNFDVVVKFSPNTHMFIDQMLSRPYVNMLASGIDKEVVNKYEQLYQEKIISLEVTKPSEQAFKALCDPNLVGGSILLFAEPVGRQEYDNLYFLERHDLIANSQITEKLQRLAREKKDIPEEEHAKILNKISTWRGIRLPKDPVEAADFVWWCFKQDIFPAMLGCRMTRRDDRHRVELAGIHGVQRFWETVENFVSGAPTQELTSSSLPSNPQQELKKVETKSDDKKDKLVSN